MSRRLAWSPPWRLARAAFGAVHERRILQDLSRQARPDPRPKVLVINHFFDNELKVLQRSNTFGSRFQLLTLPPAFFNRNLAYFPPDVWSAASPYEDVRWQGRRRLSARHARDLWRRLLTGIDNVAALVTPSDIFYWLREFVRSAPTQVPTFVFDKEGTISPAGFDTHSQKVRREFPPIAEHYYLWSTRQEQFWQRAGLEPGKARVLGSLRTDLYVNMPPPQRTGVLFFDFAPGAYLNALSEEERRRLPGDWRPLKQELHGVVKSLAAAHPDVPFTVKCHPQQPDVEAVRKGFRDVPNVQVDTGSKDVDQIVADHSICIGFQTTALLEVALTTRPAIYAGWGPLHDALAKRMVPLMEPGFGVHRVPDAESLRESVETHLQGRPLRRPSSKRIEVFFYKPDGNVAARYAEAFLADTGLADRTG